MTKAFLQSFGIFLSVCCVTALQASVPRGIVKLTTGVFANGGQIRDIKIDSSGRIVACGYTFVGGQRRWTVARFTAEGFLDTSFNSVGYYQYTIDSSSANSIAFQTDGKIVVVGLDGTGGGLRIRYTTSGSVDIGARVVTGNPVGVAIDTTGTYILVVSIINNGSVMQLSREVYSVSVWNGGAAYVSNITLALGNIQFGVGAAVMKPTSNDFISAVGIAGITGTGFQIATNPYNGLPTIFTNTSVNIHNIVAQTDNILVMSQWNGNNHSLYKTTNGTISPGTTFNILPSTTNTFPYNTGGGLTLTADNNKVLLCAGTTTSNATPQPFISRSIVLDGSLDATFGTGGITVQTEAAVTPGYYAAVALQSDGKAVVGGFTENGNSNGVWLLARYTTAGVLDTSFGSLVDPTGLLQDTASPFNTGASGVMYGGMLDADGKLVLCGTYNNVFTELRYTTTGGRDGNLFGVDGVVQLPLLNAATGYAVAQDSAGNYYTAGESTVSSNLVSTLVKLDNTGDLEYAAQETGLGIGSARAVEINTDGTVVVGGQTTVSGVLLPTLINYTAAGQKIPTFGTNGVQIVTTYGTGVVNGLSIISPASVAAVAQMSLKATLLQYGQSNDLLDELNNGF